MLTSHPPAALKPMRPRTGLRAAVCAFGLAAVLVAAVGPPAQESPAEAASHEDRPAGSVWAAGTAGAATWQWTHTNLWVCDRAVCDDSAGIGQGSARRGATESTTCAPLPRAATESAAYAAGCNGHKPGNSGWRFTGHDDANTGSKVPGSALYACTATGAPVSDPAHCGAWAACSSTTVPNTARAACVPCPPGQEPDPGDRDSCRVSCSSSGQHRHGTGECEDNHPYGAAGPDCPTGNTVLVTRTWTYHNAAKENTSGSKRCCPSGQHLHGSGACGPDYAAEPACPGGNTVPVTRTWTYHNAAGADATGTKRCGVPRCPDGRHRHGATGACGPDHPYGRAGPVCATGLAADLTVRWVYHNTAGADTAGEKICPRADNGGGGGGGGVSECARSQYRVRPFGKVWGFGYALLQSATDWVPVPHVPTPHPLSWPPPALWQPRVAPAAGAAAARGVPFEVSSSAGGDWLTGALPSRWTRGGRWVQQPGETAAAWEPGRSIYKNVGCARVTVSHAGSGWRLTNLTLADPEAATSGTGRGRRTFTATGLIDDTKPAGFAAYDRWTVTVELFTSVGAPFPGCTVAASGADGRVRGSMTAARPSRNPARSCSWTVTLWAATAVRLNPCGSESATRRDSEGNVLYCVFPGI